MLRAVACRGRAVRKERAIAARGRDEEIEEILGDTSNEDEQIAAWEVTFQDRVALPFAATTFGVPVESLDPDRLPADFVHVLDVYRSWQGRE